MNQRNVEAIAEILRGYMWHKEYPEDRLLALAEVLAARGVLVPSVLTDAECRTATDDGALHWGIEDSEYLPNDFRASLERIAKGETQGD